MIKKFSIITIALFSMCACKNNETTSTQVLNSSEYNEFLSTSVRPSLEKANKFKTTWKAALDKDSMGLGNLQYGASAYSQMFSVTGDIAYLDTTVVLQERAHRVAADLYKAGTARALAVSYISQHNFKAAKDTLEPRFKVGTKKLLTELMLFDVYMELGEYDQARTFLDSIKNNENYDYLIRAAKWNDHTGNLNQAIALLEKARDKAESSKSTSLQIWTHSNLGDFYGHAGRIKDSFDSYMKTLELQPDNAYVKKGLAWIAYSNDKNPDEALRIIDSIQVTHKSPDYHLLKAEIFEFKGDEDRKQRELDVYWDAVQNPSYGDMYNAYNIIFLAEEKEDYEAALTLAKKEINNRATPETYQLLAYAHLLAGHKEESLSIIEKHVEGKTFEPDALFHSALIYKANGMMDKVNEIKNEELLGTAYEMGPVTYERIKAL